MFSTSLTRSGRKWTISVFFVFSFAMFPANVIAPSPIYQSWFRAPIFQQQQQQHLQQQQPSVLHHPGYVIDGLLPRSDRDTSPSGRSSSDGSVMTSDAATAMAAAQAAFLAAAAAASDGDTRQAFNMYRYRQYQLHQQHIQAQNTLAAMSCTASSCPTTHQQDTTRYTMKKEPDSGDFDDTELVHHSDRRSPSTSPSSVPKSSPPRLKFSVSAILSSEISPKNRKGEPD